MRRVVITGLGLFIAREVARGHHGSLDVSSDAEHGTVFTMRLPALDDPVGLPVLHLHGSPDCRVARHPDDSIAARLGVRLIAVDRPGYGATDPLPAGEGVRAWADDVAVLLDDLGIERCRVAAWSAGSNWAWGIAAELPPRVERVLTFGALAAFEDLLDPEVRAAS